MRISTDASRQVLGTCTSHATLEPFPAPDGGRTPGSMTRFQTSSPCSPVETRRLARALERRPVPLLTKRDTKSRWRVGPDTVGKILGSSRTDAGPEKSRLVLLTSLLAIEEFSDPLASWLMSTDDAQAILRADLLTPEEVCEGLGSLPPMHINSLYRRLEDGRLSSIRIGKQHRFRRSLEGARLWISEHEEEA